MALPNKAPWSEWSFQLRVGANRVNGIYSENKYAFNPLIVGTTEDVWNEGGVLSFLSAAETMSLVSSDGADDGDPQGNGAWQVEVFGVGNDYQPVSEIVTLNGTMPVVTTASFLRINRMRIIGAGSNGTNVGTITATASTAATVQASIGAGLGSTTKSQYTVPAGFFAFVLDWKVSTLNNDQVEADFQTRVEDGAWILRNRLTFVESAVEQNFLSPLVIAPKSDIRVQAVRISGSGNVRVSSNYDFYLVKESLVGENNVLRGG